VRERECVCVALWLRVWGCSNCYLSILLAHWFLTAPPPRSPLSFTLPYSSFGDNMSFLFPINLRGQISISSKAEVPNDLCCSINLSCPLADTILALLKYYAFKGNQATVKSLQQRMVTSSWSEPRIANHKIDQILQSYCEFLKLCGLRFKLFHDGNQPFVYIVVVVECCLELRFTHFRAKLEWVQLLGACREKHKSKLSMCDDGCWVERYLKNFQCEKLHST